MFYYTAQVKKVNVQAADFTYSTKTGAYFWNIFQWCCQRGKAVAEKTKSRKFSSLKILLYLNYDLLFELLF